MILNLPSDVENYILCFAINCYSINNISKVCKNWRNIINNSEYEKERKVLYNRTRMLLEDKENFLEDSYLDLAKKWEKFHSYRWDILYNKHNDYPEEKSILWKVGDYVDVRDKINAWAPAKIIGIDCGYNDLWFTTSYITYRRYKVQFLGWSNGFNESVGSSCIRKLGYHTIIPNNKFDSIGKERFWALLNINNEWKMTIIRGIIPPPPPLPPPTITTTTPPPPPPSNPLPPEENTEEENAEEENAEEEIFNNLPEPEPQTPQTPLSGNANIIRNPNIKLLDTIDGIISVTRDDINEKMYCSSNMMSFLLTPYRFNPKNREKEL
jgi:hypothetical protein